MAKSKTASRPAEDDVSTPVVDSPSVSEMAGPNSEANLLDSTSNWLAASRARFALICATSLIPMSLAISIALYEVIQAISGPTQYPELITGAMALSGGVKSGDAVLVFSFWIILGIAAGIVFLCGPTRERRINLVPVALVLLVFSAAFLVMAFSRGTLSLLDQYSPVWMFALAQMLVILAFCVRGGLVALSNRRSSASPAVEPTTTMTLLWLAISSLAFVPASGLIVGARYLGLVSTTNEIWLNAGMLAVSLVVVTAVTIAFWDWCIRGRNLQLLLSLIVSLLGIASLPLLLPPLLTIDDAATAVPGILKTRWLIALACIVIAIVAETGIRGWLARGTRAAGGVFSSVAIAALIVPLRITSPLPTVEAMDNYHFGELFTPAYLFLTQGMTGPIPMARGPIVNLFPQLMNSVVSSGTASTFFYALPLVLIVLLALGHALLRFSVGTFAATVILVTYGFANYFSEADFATWVIVLFAVDLVRRDRYPWARGIAIGFSLAGAIVLYPLMGIAGSVVTVVLLISKFAGALVARQFRQVREQAIVVSLSFLVFLVVYLFDPAKGLQSSIQYVVSQAQGNLLAHGIPISRSLASAFTDSFFVTYAFGLVGVVCLGAMWYRRSWLMKPDAKSWLSFALLGVPAAVAIGLSSRFLGRIAEQSFAIRPMQGSLLVVGLILPICLLLADARAFRKLALICLGAGLAISIAAVPLFPGGIQKDVTGINHGNTWATAGITDTIPVLGIADADPKALDGLRNIGNVSSAISTKLTIQNLSNRNALNAYFEWPNSGDYLAPYNIPDRSTEREFVTALSGSAPQALFLGPAMWFDGLSMSLRTPLLAAWVEENYVPVKCPGSQWAVRDTWATTDYLSVFPAGCVVGSEPTIARALWSESIGAPADLQYLPYSWGAMVDSYPIGTSVPFSPGSGPNGEQSFVAQLSGPASPGRDYLRVDTTCSGLDPMSPNSFADVRTSSKAVLSWTRTDSTEPNVLTTFEWGAGSFLIPLSAYPEWTLPPWSSGTLNLVPPSGSCPEPWSVVAHFVEPTR